MASDRKQYDRAMEKWKELKNDKLFSRPVGEGVVGILCSYWPVDQSDNDAEASPGSTKSDIKDRKILRKEALRISDIANEHGRDSELVLNARENDFFDLLTDPSVSDLILIGNGNFSSFYLPDSAIEWGDVSIVSDHLKQGNFTQRHCGFYAKNLSVPVGMFAVCDFSSVYAAAGCYIYPRGLYHPDSKLIQPVFEEGEIPEYGDIKRWFPKGPVVEAV